MSRGVVGGVGLTFGDLARTMAAIEEHHKVKVTMSVTYLPGTGGGLAWVLLATSRLDLGSTDDPFNPRTWAVDWSEYSPDLGRTASSLYRYLLKLDVLLSQQRWVQTQLPEG